MRRTTGDGGTRDVDPDSRARTLLANERTFLAWIRTGLSMVAIGMAVAQFIGAEDIGGIDLVSIFSVFLSASGVLLTVFAAVQFIHARNRINAGTYHGGTIAIGITVLFALVSGILGIIVILSLRQAL